VSGELRAQLNRIEKDEISYGPLHTGKDRVDYEQINALKNEIAVMK